MTRGTWVAVLVVVTAGCGAANQQARTSGAATPSWPPATATSSPLGKCCLPPSEPSLQVNAEPSAGPPGTLVRLRITGCGDADPGNAATVSYNKDSENTAARDDPKTVVDLGVHHGTRITLTYKITAADRTGGVGRFYVQCGQTLLDTVFNVT